MCMFKQGRKPGLDILKRLYVQNVYANVHVCYKKVITVILLLCVSK